MNPNVRLQFLRDSFTDAARDLADLPINAVLEHRMILALREYQKAYQEDMNTEYPPGLGCPALKGE